MSKEWVKRIEDSHAKVDNVTVTVWVVVVVEERCHKKVTTK